jgi:hypothetical protein
LQERDRTARVRVGLLRCGGAIELLKQKVADLLVREGPEQRARLNLGGRGHVAERGGSALGGLKAGGLRRRRPSQKKREQK